jgi:hypothetical protein
MGNLFRRLKSLERAQQGTPSPFYGVLIELCHANGRQVPSVDKNDHNGVMAELIELLPN